MNIEKKIKSFQGFNEYLVKLYMLRKKGKYAKWKITLAAVSFTLKRVAPLPPPLVVKNIPVNSLK